MQVTLEPVELPLHVRFAILTAETTEHGMDPVDGSLEYED